jgi:hypothetical protein
VVIGGVGKNEGLILFRDTRRVLPVSLFDFPFALKKPAINQHPFAVRLKKIF